MPATEWNACSQLVLDSCTIEVRLQQSNVARHCFVRLCRRTTRSTSNLLIFRCSGVGSCAMELARGDGWMFGWMVGFSKVGLWSDMKCEVGAALEVSIRGIKG